MTPKDEGAVFARVVKHADGFYIYFGEKSIGPMDAASAINGMDNLNLIYRQAVRAEVGKALEMAAVRIGEKADSRKCLAYGHDDRWCAYCDAYDYAIDISQQAIRALAREGK